MVRLVLGSALQPCNGSWRFAVGTALLPWPSAEMNIQRHRQKNDGHRHQHWQYPVAHPFAAVGAHPGKRDEQHGGSSAQRRGNDEAGHGMGGSSRGESSPATSAARRRMTRMAVASPMIS